MPQRARQGARNRLLELATGMLPILTAVVGGLWGLYHYLDQQRENQEAAVRQMEKDSQARLIQAQQPFLVKQLDLYFETAKIAGKLVSLEHGSPEWNEAKQRFWALYWSELSMVEHPKVEAAMKSVGERLREFEASPKPKNKTNLENSVYGLAHAIRSGIESAWGSSAARRTTDGAGTE